MKIQTIVSGKNNLVRKVYFKNKKYIYKKYIKNNTNGIKYSRYNSETSFIKFLRKKNIKNLPSIIKTNPKTQENLFNFIEGKKIEKITKKDILQCINFIKKINKNIFDNRVTKYKKATEACLSIDSHIETAQRRIKMLSITRGKNGIYKKAAFFVKKTLQKKLVEIKKIVFKTYSKKDAAKKLEKKKLILSPSDFGFHNVIKKNSKLFFFDFEYAGMDDPVKLISDFICQPDHKLSKKQSLFFYKNILKIFSDRHEINRRFNAVIHIHRIKWCCVILSEILNKKYFERRKFAGSNINMAKCFAKAKKYYNQYLKKVNLKCF